MQQDVLFWIRSPTEDDYTYDFAFQVQGVSGPDDNTHVVIDNSQLEEFVEIVQTLRESYGQQHQDREEESEIFNQEGGIIIVRH